jgi:histidine triad (HIT) family protein
MDCLFCKVANGDVPAELIYEDDKVVAFRDIAPQAPVHCLIIPREHIPSINDLNEEHTALMGHLIQVATKIASEQGVATDGYRLNINCNPQGGQTVYHIHLHLLGGRQMSWPPG